MYYIMNRHDTFDSEHSKIGHSIINHFNKGDSSRSQIIILIDFEHLSKGIGVLGKQHRLAKAEST